MTKKLIAAALGLALTSPAYADICDYRPSKLIGKAATAVVEGAAIVAAGTGPALEEIGYYSIAHAPDGAAMIASTLAGDSAAGTVGIIEGSGGFFAEALAFFSNPVTITVGAVVAVGIVAFEGACWIADDE